MRSRSLLLALLLAQLSCDVPAGEAGASGKGGYHYRVQRGETLFSIAEDLYGNGLEWPRLHEANPWVEPDRLQVGELIYVPRTEEPVGPGPVGLARVGTDPGPQGASGGVMRTSDPGRTSANSTRGRSWTIPQLSEKRLFGVPVHQLGFFALASVLFHAVFQGFFIWITANVAFVRNATIRKSMKATFLSELLTLCTVVLLSVVAVTMLYIGTSNPGEVDGEKLFAIVEQYLGTPLGSAVALVGILGLYTVLSLRFIPQVFDIQMGRAFTIVFLSILIPHLSGIYLVGHRLGWFPT